MKKYLLLVCLMAFNLVVSYAQSTPPALTAASNATVDATFIVSYVDDAIWEVAIDSVSYNGIKLTSTAGYVFDISANSITINPSIDPILQTSGTFDLVVYANGYNPAVVSQTIKHGVASQFVIETQPAAPATNGGVLGTQPVVKLQDQYSNFCTSDITSQVGVSASGASWNLGGTTPQTASSGTVNFVGLTASSDVAVSGATITFSLGLFSVVSVAFDIPVNSPPVLTIPSDASVDSDFEITFVSDDVTWRDSITEIRYGTDILPFAAYDKTVPNKIILKPVQSAFLQVSGTKNLTIVSKGYSDAIESVEIKHGVASQFVIETQPAAPATNGGVLGTQPVVKLHDQYNNVCSTDNLTTITAASSGGTWTLGGTSGLTANSGIFTYNGLTASSNSELTTATITFSSFSLADVESNSFTIPSLNNSPQLLAAASATVDSPFEISFIANPTWQLAIDSITYGGNLISSVAYDMTQSGKIIFDPSKDLNIQVPGTKSLIVYATGYENTSVSQEIKHGAPSIMVIVLQPSAPVVNGGELITQPGLTLRDKYGNDCTSESSLEITAAKGDANEWVLGGTVTRKVTNGSLSYSNLTASSLEAVSGAFINFTANGLSAVNSNLFDIPDLSAGPTLTSAINATVDADFEVTFTENTAWRTQISQIKYGAEILPVIAYDKSFEGRIIFKPSQSSALQTATNNFFVITSTSFLSDTVQQEIFHGTAKSIVITTQPQGPDNNGDFLQTQPVVKLQDQYQNDCITNNSTTINASATGEGWNLEGTTSLVGTNGVVAYTNLSARSTDLVSNATITFSGTGLTNQESVSFLIPAPLFAPSLIASSTATVDSPFDITFAESPDWQGKIDSIYYGDFLLASGTYDKSQAGKITFDPAKDIGLQVADTKTVIVYARGFQNASVNQEIKHGVPDTLLIETQPEAPLINGDKFDLQPKISVKDKYGNSCLSESEYVVTVAKGDAGEWILGGSLSQAVTGGVINYKDLTASSENAVSNAFLSFSGDGIVTVNSNTFNIPDLLNPPNVNPAFLVTVDEDFSLSYDFDDTWASAITIITYEGDTLPNSAYDIESSEIVFHVSEEVLLQKAGTFQIVIHAKGYRNATIEQEVGHGVVARMEITQQPLSPPANGDLLAQQPILKLLDKYGNVCNTENQKLVTVSKSDSGEWNLAGTIEQQAVDGLVSFSDLSAHSAGPVSGAALNFSSADLDDVVSDFFDISDVALSPILVAAVDANVDAPFTISFTEDSLWRSRINVITVNDSVLVAESIDTSVAGELKLIPSASEFLQKAGSYQVIVQSRGFANDTVQQDIHHGLPTNLNMVVQPVGPQQNGGLLAQQPIVKLIDQYKNDCSTNSLTMVSVLKADVKSWQLGGNLEVQSSNGSVQFTDLTATSEIAIDSAFLKFFFEKDTLVSNQFTIPVPVIQLIAADNVTVDNEFVIQASNNSSWRDSISAISFAGQTLADTSYLIESGTITFYPSKDLILQIARTDTIVVVANGYADALVEQNIAHGKATEMVIVDQPIGPENNGDTLAIQPQLQLKDQYQNNCSKDNSTLILVSKYSDGSATDVFDLWELGGTKTVMAIGGLVKFTNLTATSENRVDGAKLLFTSEGLPDVISDSFDIVIPPPPIIIPAENANVDESFYVEFTDNKTWRSLINDIRYGIRSLEGNYDVSEPGRITFDPSIVSILQKSGVDSIYIYSGNYDTVRFEQPIHHGKSKYLVISKEPSAPLANGEQLLRQPRLKLQDQYRNNCTTDNETPVAVMKGDNGEWILTGTLTSIAVEGVINYTNLVASSEMEVENAKLKFEGIDLISALSQGFTIPAPIANRAGEAKANPELVCYGERSTLTLIGFDGAIQWQKYNELDEVYVDLPGEFSEVYITAEVVQNSQYRAKVTKEGFSDQFSNSVTVSPIEPPVADFTFEIDYNQVQFTNLSSNAASITWDFGDGNVSSDFEPTHSFVLNNSNGNGYVVTLIASNEACQGSEKSRQIFITTGIDDLLVETEVVVYPNPNKGEFFMEVSPADKDGVLRIFDQSGKVVVTQLLDRLNSDTRIAFDLKGLSRGLYFLTIQYPDKLIRTKLIIQ